MTSTPEKILWISVLAFIVFFAKDFYNYTRWTLKAHDFANYSVEQMAVSGGWNEEVEQKVVAKADRMGIDFTKWSIRHTEGLVSAPGEVTFGLDTRYHITAFGVLGKRMEDAMEGVAYLPIIAQKETTSQINTR